MARLSTAAAGCIVLIAIAIAIAGVPATAWAAPSLAIVQYQLVTTRRVGVTVYDYTYRVQVRNLGTAAAAASTTLTGFPASVTVLDGNVNIGDVAAGATVPGQDTFKIRHNRLQGAVSVPRLRWTFSFTDPLAGQLQGDPAAAAVGATRDYIEPGTFNPAAVSQNASGRSVLRTEFLVSLRPDATIGQVNSGMAAVGGRISGMTAGRLQIAVAVPDPGSLTALETLRAQLEAQPGFAVVMTSVFPTTEVLPPNTVYDPVSAATYIQFIQHHLAIRAQAAWNLQGLLNDPSLASRRPAFVFDDYFGFGEPNHDYWGFAFANASDYGATASVDNSRHGYQVMSVVGAAYGGLSTNNPEDVASGLFPEHLPVRAVDNNRFGGSRRMLQLVQIVRDLRFQGRNVIVNSSLGGCRTGCTSDDLLDNHLSGQAFIDLVRGYGTTDSLEDDFLLFQAAGNETSELAYKTSEYNVAAAGLLVPASDIYQTPDLLIRRKSSGAPDLSLSPPFFQYLDKLDNIVTVEARTIGVAGPSNLPAPSRQETPPTPACLASYSNRGGTVSAVGGDLISIVNNTGVYVLNGPQPANGTTFSKGTSFAAPQAAAVAAWIWSLRPDLSVAKVKQLLLQTTKTHSTSPASCDPVREPDSHPVVDVYSAALATDNPFFDDPLQSRNLGNTTAAPVRQWLLDVASTDASGNLLEDQPDGKFTQADILKFLKEFAARKGNTDYSRYDLNGNASTGEPYLRTDVGYISRFDLNGDLAWTTANQTIQGLPVAVDEDMGADISVLIYYAYSPLYTGNEYERTLLLLPYLDVFNIHTLFLDGLDIDVGPGQQTVQIRDITFNPRGSTFTSSCAGGPRGTPVYDAGPVAEAQQVGVEAVFWKPANQYRRYADELPNAVNCSSFVATVPSTGRWWINVAARARVPDASGVAGSDNEYQMRVYLGEPDLAAGPAGAFTPPPRRLLTQVIQWGRVLSDTLDPPGSVGPFQPDAGFPTGFRAKNFLLVPGL